MTEQEKPQNEDTEGQGKRRAAEDSEDDTEGQSKKRISADEDEDDAEGHRRR